MYTDFEGLVVGMASYWWFRILCFLLGHLFVGSPLPRLLQCFRWLEYILCLDGFTHFSQCCWPHSMADSSVRNRLIVEWAPCRRPCPGFCCLLWVPWSLPDSADATSGVRSATPCHGSVWLKGIFWMPCDGLCDSWDRPLSWRQTKITSGWVPGNESEVLSNSEALGFCAFVLSEGLSQLLSCLILLRTLEVYRAALSHPEATNETRHRKEW